MLALRTVSLRDDLEVALESESSGETADFTQSERTILKNVLELGEKRVDDVMVPRADIEAIDAERDAGRPGRPLPRRSAIRACRSIDDNLDNITGFIHVKDALRRITEPVTDPENSDCRSSWSPTPLKQKIGKLDLVRAVLFVPPLMPVGDLLQQMQLKRVHMAVVIDEYGGTDGLVTIEDLLEAVVGEIEDEHDDADVALVRKINSNIFIACGPRRTRTKCAGDRPRFRPRRACRGRRHARRPGVRPGRPRAAASGEIVGGIKGFEFEVLQSDGRQVKRVKIKRLKQRTARPVPGSRTDGGGKRAAAE